MKNPTFGVYPLDDDHIDFGHEVIDPRVNVEKQVVDLLAESVEAHYPQTNSIFNLRNDRNMNCTVIIVQGGKKTIWQSSLGPCITKNDNLYNSLCDGRVPTCEGFHPGGQGYDPTGCRNFHKCSRNWTRMTVHKKKLLTSDKIYPGLTYLKSLPSQLRR